MIVTGETAKKQNAAEIVQRLAHETGNFVSASAGPNFESVLGAMGSGIVEISRKNQNTILNVDIGGGTSNLALVSKGEIISTSCINIGGRLLGIDQNFKIWRMDEPTKVLMKHLNWDYHLGEVIPEEHVITLSKLYAKILMEVMQGPASSDLAKSLMMTDDLDFILPIDAISFSGGVGELIYGENKSDFNDIGKYLAEEINKLIKKTNYTLIEPNNKIRATVIGAGSFSLSVSGSTCYCDPSIKLPLENIPVVPIKISIDDLKTSYSKLKDKVAQSLKNYDLKEGKDHYALYFKDIIVRSDLELFAKTLEHALPNTIRNEKLILIILGTDGGKMLGLAIKKHTAVKSNLLCLDELELKAGDWIDIGSPLRDKNAFPVTIKSLAFSGKKENI